LERGDKERLLLLLDDLKIKAAMLRGGGATICQKLTSRRGMGERESPPILRKLIRPRVAHNQILHQALREIRPEPEHLLKI